MKKIDKKIIEGALEGIAKVPTHTKEEEKRKREMAQSVLDLLRNFDKGEER